MAKQIIDTGTSPNKGDGDPLRSAFTKINNNFNEVYTALGDPSGATSDVLPNTDGTIDLGSADKQWDDLYVKNFIYVNGARIEVTNGGALLVNGGAPAEVQDTVGSVFGDDSTILVDGINNKIVGPIQSTSILPGDGSTDIGSTSNRFYNAWFTGQVETDSVLANIFYGPLTGNVTGDVSGTAGAVAFSGITGKPTTLAGYGITDAMVSGAAHDGDITGSVFGDDSTVLVDGVNNIIPKANIEDSANWDTAFGWGNHTAGGYAPQTTTYTKTEVDSAISAVNTLDGDFTGSVFGDDSTLLVDGINNKIVGTVETASLTVSSTNVAIGSGAGTDVGGLAQGAGSIAIGFNAGNSSQNIESVAIGVNAGKTSQGEQSVAIGAYTAFTSQGNSAVAIGDRAGVTSQGTKAVAIGRLAGDTSQGAQSIAIGVDAGKTSQGENAVAIGNSTGSDTQGIGAVAIGPASASLNQGASAVAIGYNAGVSSQGARSVAIGEFAGQATQAANSIVLNATGNVLNNTTASSLVVKPIRSAVGTTMMMYNATSGEITHTASPVITGDITGSVFGDDSTVLVDGVNNKIVGPVETFNLRTTNPTIALGYLAGQTDQEATSVAIGSQAGNNAQNVGAVGIGYKAGNNTQGLGAVALGYQSGQNTQGGNAVAIGELAGQATQGGFGIAIGYASGQTTQGASAVAIGRSAGSIEQSLESIAIGKSAAAGATATATYVSGGVASTTMVVDDTTGIIEGMRITDSTGFTYTLLEQQHRVVSVDNATTLTISAVANAGTPSGTITFSAAQDYYAVAIGSSAGLTSQGPGSVAIGYLAGKVNQEAGIAIGSRAGEVQQDGGAVAVGVDAGRNNQGTHGVAIGKFAGGDDQGMEAIAIGYFAGDTGQGVDSIAIGKEAGKTNQAARSIILNATDSPLNTTQTDSLIIKPIRNLTMTTILGYDAGTGEVTHNAAIPGYTNTADLKALVAASTDFTDFQTRIAAL